MMSKKSKIVVVQNNFHKFTVKIKNNLSGISRYRIFSSKSDKWGKEKNELISEANQFNQGLGVFIDNNFYTYEQLERLKIIIDSIYLNDKNVSQFSNAYYKKD
jgi:post-segregation antitoxin (ccd killing protein)